MSEQTSYEIRRIKPLEWREEEPNWWAAAPDLFGGRGYEVRVTDRGRVRVRRFGEDWEYFDGTDEDAKAAYQRDFEQRIYSAIEWA